MPARVLMNGEAAIAEAAIRAGCRFYAGYVITPSQAILDYMSANLADRGGVCMVPESEMTVINMAYGAAVSGVRSMVGTCGTGLALMQETLGHMASSRVPCVIVNLTRNTLQGEYTQVTRGGAGGDYHIVVLAPSTVQEAVNLTYDAFDIGDRYRTPVILLGDYVLAKTTETVEFPASPTLPAKPWAVTGAQDRKANKFGALASDETSPGQKPLYGSSSKGGDIRRARYAKLANELVRAEEVHTDDCSDLLVVAFGTAARFSRLAIEMARSEGLRVGMIRPISLWPFPTEIISKAATKTKAVLVIELNDGQMIFDVRIAVAGRAPIESFNVSGGDPAALFTGYGNMFSTQEALEAMKSAAREVVAV